MKNSLKAALLATALVAAIPALAQTVPNMGSQKPEADTPFNIAKVAEFDTQGWRMAFLPDGRMLVNEKGGKIWLVTQAGVKTEVTGVPPVLYGGQGGLLAVYLSPNYARDSMVYLTYSEPVEETAPVAAGGRGASPACPAAATALAGKVCGSSLALARARLVLGASPSLQNVTVLWRDGAGGAGGQFGGAVAFRDNLIYLSVGDRQRMTPAQDPNSPLGKIIRMTMDGKPAPGNPQAGKTGSATIPIIRPPGDTEVAKTAPVVREYTFPNNQNLTPSYTFASGFRTPYGMAFAPNGELWELEHGPGGGDELNLIQAGKNYGWPSVSYGPNYNKVPVPSHDTDNSFQKPVVQWTPIIGPGNLVFVRGPMFKAWEGNAIASGMASRSLTRIVFDGKGGAKVNERWSVPFGVRDIAIAPDGAIWLSEGGLNNSNKGGLYRVTPK
jgi:glucose/arabinose dehydrogenase